MLLNMAQQNGPGDRGERREIPPPGQRTGEGSKSIVPYLVKSLKTKPQVHVQPQDARPGIDFPDSGF